MGNPNVPAPSYIKEAVLDIFDTVPTQKIHSYTVAPGNPEVREILAKDINRRFGTHFTKDNLFMTAGAAASISITFKALAEPGDEFVIVAPFSRNTGLLLRQPGPVSWLFPLRLKISKSIWTF